MPNIVLSRDNPLSSVNRWGITDGTYLLSDEDGRVALFYDRGAAERHVELFTLYNGRHGEFRAVPVPYTLWGNDMSRYTKTLVSEALIGETEPGEWSDAASWAATITGIGQRTETTCQEDASLWLAILERMGVKP